MTALGVTSAVPALDGATVMLVRDGPHYERPLEVFMLRRSAASTFGGMHCFPGGRVDDSDRDLAVGRFCAGRSEASSSAELGIDSGGLAFWVAAIRETFEEAGVLLARGADGTELRLDGSPHLERRFDRHRADVDQRRRRLVDVIAEEGLRLAVDEMHYFAHWITPVGAPARFDTRFFVARAPEGHAYLHDDRELTASSWVRPGDALEWHRAGRFDIIEPTIRSLEALARFATAEELLATLAGNRGGATGPRMVADGGGRRVRLPGDARDGGGPSPAPPDGPQRGST